MGAASRFDLVSAVYAYPRNSAHAVTVSDAIVKENADTAIKTLKLVDNMVFCVC